MGFIKAFLKKYAALLPPAGLVLFAILLLPPVLWLGGRVSANMQDSVREAQTLRSLMQDVPPADKPAVLEAYMNRLESDVEQIEALLKHSSQRELVAYNIFPAPVERSSQIFAEYGEQYVQAVDDLLSSINARDAPSESEIRARTGTGRTQTRTGMTTTRRTAEEDPMVDALCRARAESISVYANPASFAWYDFWKQFEFEGTDDALTDCWHSQVALWIFEDVVQSIEAINAGSSKVSTSPVKRLLGVGFSGPVQVLGERRRGSMFQPTTTRGRTQTAGRDMLNYVSDTTPSKFVDTAWTGRVNGPDYDVVHFAVSVIIDNRYVLEFMRELSSGKEHSFFEDFDPDGPRRQSSRNQISILNNSIHVVQKDDPVHALYRYGDGAVMRLDLACEYLLRRDGYDMIKPDPVLKQLGQDEPASDSDMGAPAGGGFGMF